VLGCGATPNEPAPAQAARAVGYADIADVVYRQGATDEGLLTLLNAPERRDAAGSPAITAPPDHAVLSQKTAFIYEVGPSARREPKRRSRLSTFGSEVVDALTWEREAFAHGAPMNGDAFFVSFEAADRSHPLRVFTQDSFYAPTPPEWQTLVSAGGTLTLSVTHAIFDQGRLTEDGGPFVGEPLVVSVTAAP